MLTLQSRQATEFKSLESAADVLDVDWMCDGSHMLQMKPKHLQERKMLSDGFGKFACVIIRPF